MNDYRTKLASLLALVVAKAPGATFTVADLGFQRDMLMGRYLTTHRGDLRLEVVRKDVNKANVYRKG